MYRVCNDGRDGPAGAAFLCPNGTIFNQEHFLCDHWYNVDCKAQAKFYDLNLDPYTNPYIHPPKDDKHPHGPGYHAPEPSYHEPKPYHAPAPAYHKPEPYHAPAYHKPEPTYHAVAPYKPEPAYHEPAPAYHEPAPYKPEPAPYHAPAPAYHEPAYSPHHYQQQQK